MLVRSDVLARLCACDGLLAAMLQSCFQLARHTVVTRHLLVDLKVRWYIMVVTMLGNSSVLMARHSEDSNIALVHENDLGCQDCEGTVKVYTK